MANIGELSVGVKVDQGSINSATKKIKDDFKQTWDQVEKSMTQSAKAGAGGIRSAFSGLGWLIAWALSVGAVVAFGKKLLGLWSDMEEVSSKFDVVFKWSEKVKQEFQNMADATNRSNLDLITFGSSIGNVLAPLWLAQEEVDGLSVWLTKLAIDVASFNNASDEQAVHAFTSALTGEREALKSLGIVISEQDVLNKAYSLGLANQWQELTKAQKALSTYQLLIENTKNAHGDAIRTADSFANQLKWLNGAIKDVFANAWQWVAKETAGLLKNITVFVSSYGKAIIETITFAGKMIGWVIKDLLETFGDLFSFITWGTGQNKDDMQSFALVFMKVVQGFWVGVKFIATIIKSLVDVIAIALAGIIEYFVASFNAIVKGWSIVKTAFIGTLKTIIDSVQLGAEVIAQVFVGMAEAIVGVFKGIADNVAVAIKKAGNFAIKGINSVIDAVNKIPWVNLDRLVEFGDANFSWFSLGISKNMSAIWAKFDAFGAKVSSNYAWISGDLQSIATGFKTATANVAGVTEQAVGNMAKDWWELATDIETSNAKIDQSIADGANNALENAKKYDTGYYNILDLIDKYKGGVDDANKKTKWQWDVAKDTMDKIKKLYSDWEKKVDDLNDAQKKLAEDTKKYNQDIEDSLRSLQKELDDTTAEYNKFLAETNQETWADLATRGVEVQNELKDVEKEIADLKAKSITDAQDEIDRQNELLELEKQKTALIKEQEFVKANTTDAQRGEATRVAGLSEAEKIKEEADAKIAEQKRVFDEEKTRIESLQKINKVFLDLKSLDEKTYNDLLKSEKFKAMTEEEQNLILKLAREKLELTIQKDAVIAMQQEISDRTVELSNVTTAIQQANINTLKSEYQTLIGQINSAIARQRELNALRASGGFASGGFTWDGWVNEVAGVVHKGEWVAPKWMVNSMRPLFDNLEASRSKGFASGWHTSTVNKNQTNNITVNNWGDLRGFLDYARWKM